MIYSLQNQKDLQNALGFVPLYSVSPAIAYDSSESCPWTPQVTNFVSIGEKDSANLLKTLEFLYVDFRLSLGEQQKNKENAETLQETPKKHGKSANFFVLEDHPLCLLRSLIGFEIMRDPLLSISDKIKSYLDFFGNFYITKRTQEILRDVLIRLEMLFSGDSKLDPKLKQILVIEGLKFKERDQLADLLKTWLLVIKDKEKDQIYWEESSAIFRNN